MDLCAAFRMFVRVAESGSFSAVAREMGLTQPAVSRQISALEGHLGARLIQRTTRTLTLTADGLDLLGHARAVLAAVENAEEAVGRSHASLTGVVRVSVGLTFGHAVIAPALHVLLARHPQLEIELLLHDHAADLVHDGMDVAVQVGEVANASLIARRIGSLSRVIVGSAAYLAGRPQPTRPEDLADHECIVFDRTAQQNTWTLHSGELTGIVQVHGRLRTNSAEAARVAVQSGLGLALLPRWLMESELAAGTTAIVLPDWRPASVALHAVYPTQRNLAPRTRAVIDFLVEQVRAHPALSDR